MHAMSSALRETVIQLFECHRATPGAPFEESHFLDYLLAEPRGKRAVHNSFAGLRRYNAFVDDVQLRFSICFSLRDFEANLPLDRFVERIAELQGSPRASLASFRNQRRHGYGWGTVAVLNFMAAVLVLGGMRISLVLAAALALLCVVANGLFVVHYLRWRAYQRRLALRLGAQPHNGT